MKRLLLAAALLCASASAQTINPNQIRPSSTAGSVLTTLGGITQWENPINGALFPVSNGIVFNTSTIASRNALYSDIVPLWNNGTCFGYLKSDGTCGTGGTTVTFQTNGANNATQTLLNLTAGSNVSLSNSGGAVTISATAGGSSVGSQGTLQTAGSTSGSFAAATAGNVMNALGNPPGDQVFGDSISAGTGATTVNFGYVNLIRPQIGGQQVLYARPGDMCLDTSVSITGNAGFPTGSYPLTIQECGTNDTTTYNTNASLQTVFQRIVTGNLLMAGVPKPNQIWAQTCAKTIGFATAENNFRNGMGLSTTASGDKLTCSINTGPLGDVAVYYRITNGGTGTFTISIAGTNQTDGIGSLGTTFDAFGDGSSTITTGNGTTSGFVGQVFTGFTPNSTVSAVFTTTAASTTTAPVEIGWVGGMPAASTANPNVGVVSPNHQNNANDSLSGTYAGYEQAIVTQLASQNLNVTYLNTRDGMVADPLCGNGSVSTMFTVCYADALHPNGPTATTGGHASMGRIIVAGIPSLITNAPPQLQNGPSNYYPSILPPVNPSTFWTPNPFFSDYGTSQFNPGILLYKTVNNLEFLTGNTTWGAILVGPNAGGNMAASLCSAGGFWGTTPASLLCPVNITGNGVGMVGATASHTGGFQAFGGATGIGGPPGAASTTITSTFASQFEGATNDVVPTGLGTSSANFPSAPLYFDVGTWSSGGIREICGAGWKMIPASGTTPLISLTLLSNTVISNGCAFNLDLSNSTGTNHLGTADAASLSTNTYSSTRGITFTTGGPVTFSCTTGHVCDAHSGTITVPISNGTFFATGYWLNWNTSYTSAPNCAVSQTNASLIQVDATTTTTGLQFVGNNTASTSGTIVVTYVCGGGN